VTGGAVLVTGGSSGIGAAMAATAAGTGRRVGVLSRRRPPLGDWVPADLTDAVGTTAAVRAWVRGLAEPLDGLVLSAVSYGHGRRHPVAETSLAEWDEVLAVNLRGQFLAVAAVLPELLARRRAVILSVSSVAALEPAPGRAHYAAAKAGALAFFRALAEELRDTGVSVVQVLPRNQVATPGLRARRPPGFSFAGYDQPEVFAGVTRAVLADLGAELAGSVVAVDSDGRWQKIHQSLRNAAY
jgi:NAD(P)-dependent dehydrogenase (short-subunit alcohol dehydrogenase family)